MNLVALRGLRGNNDSETDAIRKYLLGLALMAATADIELFLREGCLLRYAENGDQWYKVPRRGEPDPISLKPATVKTYATHAAEHFRSEWPKKFQDKWLTDSQQFSDLKYKFNLDKVNELFANQTADEEPAGD